MKKSKILLIIIAAFFMFALTACVEEGGGHTTHTFGEWTMTKAPTETTVGVKVRKCNACDVYEHDDIPVLTDESVWELIDSVDSTCLVEGNRKYSSEEFGEVNVSVPLAEHTHEVWAFIDYPTETEAGSAKGACSVCGDEIEVEVPALTDESVWTLVEEVEVNYNQSGYHKYESMYGTITVDFEKFVAPYDEKTYSSLAFDAENDEGGWHNGVVKTENAWSNATLELNKLGFGIGTAFPFRGLNEFKMIDPSTGLIEITNTPIDDSDPENPIYKVEQATTTKAYVDMKTGLIVKPFRSQFTYVHVLTPFEIGASSDAAVASSWDNAIAIEYTFDGQVYAMFVKGDQVFFNVTFKNELGETISAKDCYNAPYVYVTDSSDKLVASYGFNGEKEVELDGFEGTYSGEKALVVSGFGTVTLDGVSGTYVLSDEGFTFGAFVSNQYFEVTLDKETKTYTLVKPEVTIKFNAFGNAEVENIVANKNIALELPNPTNEQNTFKGWFYDEACTLPVEENFVPTVDVELYASWKAKVVINLVGVKNDDPAVIYLGEGDVIGHFLPKYTIDEVAFEVFRGWYIDEAFEETLTEDAIVTPEDSNFTIYAKWEKLPAYYGERKGTEIWNKNYGNSANLTLKIDENGVISGKYTGVVVSYEPETQTITWKQSQSSSKVNKFYFDPVSDLLISDYYGGDELSNDLYVFSKYQENGKLKAFYGVKCDVNGKNNFYIHFITLATEEGDMQVVRYGSRILTNVTITDTAGNTLDTNIVKNSKTVVIRDKETGEMIVGVSSKGDTFDKNNDTNALDAYFGTYTSGDSTVVLDGTGNIVYNGKSGTYTVTSAEEQKFDVYLENNTEYYQLTLINDSFEIVMPKASLSFVTGEGHVVIETQEVNINVKVTLPSGEDEGYVFNGWFLDAEFTNAVPETFIITEDTTIYAKYSMPAVLTIVYNNGEENEVIVYSVNDIAEVEMPVYKKHAFIGWFTTEDFQDGSAWESGSIMTTDVVIYAKWEVAPVYNNKYVPTEIETRDGKVTAESSLYTRTSAIIDIDPYGKAPKTGYPFNGGDITVEKYDSETGLIVIASGSTKYSGYIDAETGIIVITNDITPNAREFNKVMLLSPFETSSITSKISASYWGNGNVVVAEYTFESTVYAFAVIDKIVFFNVKFLNADGAEVSGKDCYKETLLSIVDAEGNVIAKYGHDGTTLQPLDGNEGTYKNGLNDSETLVVDGVKVVILNGQEGLYVLASENEGFTIGAYVNNTYYEILLNKEEMTYAISKPMVTVRFNTAELVTVESITTNKNIVIELPVLEHDDYVFRGWFLDAEFTKPVDNKYLPTESVTLYAKWDQKVTLEVVYGNGLENAVLVYGIGDVPAPVKPIFKDGKVFAGWFLDAELTNEYVEGNPIEGSLTIYCKWIEAVAMFGEYKGVNTYGTGNTPNNSGNKAISIDEYGNVSGSVTGKIADYDAETGKLTIVNGSNVRYGFFDVNNGVFACSYSSSSTALGTDIYLFVRADSVVCASGSGSVWAKGYVRLLKVTIDGTDMYIFIKDNIVYANVTYTSTDGEVEYNKLATSNQVTILDAEGNTIANYVKGTSGLEEANA